MENFRNAVSGAFDTRTTKTTFFEYEQYPMMDTQVHILFKKHKNPVNIDKKFLSFAISPGQPFFHSICLKDLAFIDKFNQMFQMHKTSREDFVFINDYLHSFHKNDNFSKLLIMNDHIKSHEFYTFKKLYMLEKDETKYGVTSCVHTSYRSVAQYEFIKNFSITRDGAIALFPTVHFFKHVNPFSLYFSLSNKKVYKLPESLAGLVTLEDIVEASTLFTHHDIDVFTDEILMMYVCNLHNGVYQEFLDIPQENISDKIDLLLMTTI
jgi:hypothetical protein